MVILKGIKRRVNERLGAEGRKGKGIVREREGKESERKEKDRMIKVREGKDSRRKGREG